MLEPPSEMRHLVEHFMATESRLTARFMDSISIGAYVAQAHVAQDIEHVPFVEAQIIGGELPHKAGVAIRRRLPSPYLLIGRPKTRGDKWPAEFAA